MQQFLKPPPRIAGAKIVAAELLDQFDITADESGACLDFSL
jgi:hypothetical protein